MFVTSSTVQKTWSEFINAAHEGQLSAREKAIVHLASAAFLNDATLFKQYLLDAKLQGLTNEDVSQILALAISHYGAHMLAILGDNDDGETDESCCQ